MSITKASITITTSSVDECRRFYETHFAAKPSFDCGWYQVLQLEGGETELCLMSPREGMGEFTGGVTLNLQVADVDTCYSRLTEKGVVPVIPLEDHPWGDRGFGVVDPAGVTVYCYQPIEPSDEFRQYFVN